MVASIILLKYGCDKETFIDLPIHVEHEPSHHLECTTNHKKLQPLPKGREGKEE